MDLTTKLDDYRSLETVEAILLVQPDFVDVNIYRRIGRGAFPPERYTDLGERFDIPVIDASISLEDIYDTLDPQPARNGFKP